MRKLRIKGFTLIEIIIGLVVVGIIFSIGARVFINMYNTYVFSMNYSNLAAQGRLAMGRMLEDFHNIRSNTDISVASSTALTFVNYQGNTISYTVSGTQLLRNSYLLASNVQSITFNYYNSSGTLLTAPITAANVYYIVATLVLNNGTSTLTSSSGAYLWNNV